MGENSESLFVFQMEEKPSHSWPETIHQQEAFAWLCAFTLPVCTHPEFQLLEDSPYPRPPVQHQDHSLLGAPLPFLFS